MPKLRSRVSEAHISVEIDDSTQYATVYHVGSAMTADGTERPAGTLARRSVADCSARRGFQWRAYNMRGECVAQSDSAARCLRLLASNIAAEIMPDASVADFYDAQARA